MRRVVSTTPGNVKLWEPPPAETGYLPKAFDMGKTVSPTAHSRMCLRDLVNMIDTIEDELSIYVTQEWSPDSAAIAALEPDAGGEPPYAKALGMSYFLEVSVAKEVLEGIKNLELEARTKRLIQYAVTDA